MMTTTVPVMFDETARWACLGYPDPEVFFPTVEADLAMARTVCSACPVSDRCLERGRRAGETGVWGGVLMLRGEPTDTLLHEDKVAKKGRAPRRSRAKAARAA